MLSLIWAGAGWLSVTPRPADFTHARTHTQDHCEPPTVCPTSGWCLCVVGGSYLIKPSRANGLCSQVQHNSAAPIGLTFDLLEGGAKCDWSLLQPCDSFTAFVLVEQLCCQVGAVSTSVSRHPMSCRVCRSELGVLFFMVFVLLYLLSPPLVANQHSHCAQPSYTLLGVLEDCKLSVGRHHRSAMKQALQRGSKISAASL